jgi:hypothetical protein
VAWDGWSKVGCSESVSTGRVPKEGKINRRRAGLEGMENCWGRVWGVTRSPELFWKTTGKVCGWTCGDIMQSHLTFSWLVGKVVSIGGMRVGTGFQQKMFDNELSLKFKIFNRCLN